ncbi:hypothetical protein M406DRAFT_65449 [Cryphonectria parasitica EP155]|uniref:Alpha and gamma adaptin binding protein p34 n=1 Tax=Cryphonectria parasitica (strain ATCC 38755 / EP155) TaxID=660469 RepID=A0A9P4XT29_CRYP1|nr:uncharacterized protein M406DRAFT_65449 [Cryphonectria parasitica EP155]KAF3760255.1 hypothetical protein M406DRAFT_65449 [Cryphonectria parasitica EP155]
MGIPQKISNPRRILAVALDANTELLSRVVQDLTGKLPEPVSSSLAGTTHDLDLETAYYTTTVPIWLDLITTPSDWAATFLSDEAKEVLEVLGGMVVVFAIPPPPPHAKDATSSEVGRVVREGLGGWEWDGVSLAVGVGEVAHLDDLDVWDEVCGDAGLEFVHLPSSSSSSSSASSGGEERNEFGEKVGIPRVLEALQSNDWASVLTEEGDDVLGAGQDDPHAGGDDEEKDGEELDLEDMNFGFDREDFEGLKKAIWEAQMEREIGQEGGGQGTTAQDKIPFPHGDHDKDDDAKDTTAQDLNGDDVEKVEQMMRKLQAVRDMSAGLPEEQRKRMAARAVGEVMRDL